MKDQELGKTGDRSEGKWSGDTWEGTDRCSDRDKNLEESSQGPWDQALIPDTLSGVAPTVPWGSSGSSPRCGAKVLSFSSPGLMQGPAGL